MQTINTAIKTAVLTKVAADIGRDPSNLQEHWNTWVEGVDAGLVSNLTKTAGFRMKDVKELTTVFSNYMDKTLGKIIGDDIRMPPETDDFFAPIGVGIETSEPSDINTRTELMSILEAKYDAVLNSGDKMSVESEEILLSLQNEMEDLLITSSAAGSEYLNAEGQKLDAIKRAGRGAARRFGRSTTRRIKSTKRTMTENAKGKAFVYFAKKLTSASEQQAAGVEIGVAINKYIRRKEQKEGKSTKIRVKVNPKKSQDMDLEFRQQSRVTTAVDAVGYMLMSVSRCNSNPSDALFGIVNDLRTIKGGETPTSLSTSTWSASGESVSKIDDAARTIITFVMKAFNTPKATGKDLRLNNDMVRTASSINSGLASNVRYKNAALHIFHGIFIALAMKYTSGDGRRDIIIETENGWVNDINVELNRSVPNLFGEAAEAITANSKLITSRLIKASEDYLENHPAEAAWSASVNSVIDKKSGEATAEVFLLVPNQKECNSAVQRQLDSGVGEDAYLQMALLAPHPNDSLRSQGYLLAMGKGYPKQLNEKDILSHMTRNSTTTTLSGSARWKTELTNSGGKMQVAPSMDMKCTAGESVHISAPSHLQDILSSFVVTPLYYQPV